MEFEARPSLRSIVGRLGFMLLIAVPIMAVLITVFGLALVVVGLASTGIGIAAIPEVVGSSWRGVLIIMTAAAVWLMLLGVSWRLWRGHETATK